MQQAGRIETSDGENLFIQTVPAQTRSTRSVLLVHGFSEHGARYAHVCELLSQHGWNVVVADQRGHGRSSGIPTHTTDFQRYVDDLELIRTVYCPDPDRTAILGHSMGALVAIRHAQQYQNPCAALVLMSPLLRVAVPIPLWTWLAGRVFSVIAPTFRFNSRVAPEDATRSPGRRSEHDPLVHRSITAGCFFAMQRAVAAAWSDADAIRLPMLVMQAGQDRVVDATVAHPWLQKVRSPDWTFRWYAEHYHELLNEPDWPELVHDLLVWLDQRIPARTTQAAVSLPHVAGSLRNAA